MKYINGVCADAGTINCPCPLAETGDCLICSRLAGRDKCDCSWAGLCIYNEFIQNDGIARNVRKDEKVRILRKIEYGSDLVVLELQVGREMALNAAIPGSFVFLRREYDSEFFNAPVSVMRSDVQKGTLLLTVKVISAKTKAIMEAQDTLVLRGIYRNGLLGGGLENLKKEGKWLILTKGVGFAPAVNLLNWTEGKADIDIYIDTEKITEELVSDMIRRPAEASDGLKITRGALQDMKGYEASDYDKVFILASDYYINKIAEDIRVPASKLIYANNFHMCCGEGICGACTYVDQKGVPRKMCKCRQKRNSLF